MLTTPNPKLSVACGVVLLVVAAGFWIVATLRQVPLGRIDFTVAVISLICGAGILAREYRQYRHK